NDARRAGSFGGYGRSWRIAHPGNLMLLRALLLAGARFPDRGGAASRAGAGDRVVAGGPVTTSRGTRRRVPTHFAVGAESPGSRDFGPVDHREYGGIGEIGANIGDHLRRPQRPR